MILASAASADPTFGVMNAAGGIYWRSAPDWNTAVQTSGFGFYNGTTIAVHCYQAGAANVPGSADYMWEYATDVAGPGYGTGWINEHFINDGQPINQPSPGVPPCNAPPPPQPASITASVGGQYGCVGCNSLDIVVHNFPTGTYNYYCHDNSGPGGADTVFYSNTVSVTDPNQSSWPGVFCYDSPPYTAYLVMDGVTSNSVTFAAPSPPPTASITASVGGSYGCSGCNALNIAVNNFPTGAYRYYCHDNSGPGGSDNMFFTSSVWVLFPNQSTWPGVFCYDSAPYTAYLVMDGVTSNSVTFGGSGTPSPGGGPPPVSGPTPGGTGGPPPITTPPNNPSGPGTLPGGASIYYSPFNGPWITWNYGFSRAYAPSPATVVMDASQWHVGSNCWDGLAIPSVEQGGVNGVNGRRITMVSGWSYGRNGPIMLLAAHPSWMSQIDYILLLDPGSLSDYQTGVCDKQYPHKASLVANWLAAGASNRLVVLAGKLTADYAHPYQGRGHGGIQEALFAAIKKHPYVGSRDLRKQVVVCNYDTMVHHVIWQKFRSETANPTPITKATCPLARGFPRPVAWNP